MNKILEIILYRNKIYRENIITLVIDLINPEEYFIKIIIFDIWKNKYKKSKFIIKKYLLDKCDDSVKKIINIELENGIWTKDYEGF